MNKHLSVTQIKSYLRCPLIYKFRWEDKIIVPPDSSLALGKSIHSVLELNYSQKIKTKKDLPVETLADIFSDSWEDEAKEAVFEEGEKPGNVKDEGIKIIEKYRTDISPTIQPFLVERQFELHFENVDYILKGFIDLIDEKTVIIDHKTTKRSMQQSAIDSDIQLTAYALAFRTFEGRQEQSLRFDVMVRNKTSKIQQISTTRTQEDINRFLKILAYVSKAIHSGIFYPNENYFCGICGYKELCREW
ncbi:MAG: PD-(D/E)XK nuclease family protein [Candidatus Omnitrophica bacterium]|nr:PD-(D/E)XK nuclease family protein [Candidatus Omnitrophota bacterium]